MAVLDYGGGIRRASAARRSCGTSRPVQAAVGQRMAPVMTVGRFVPVPSLMRQRKSGARSAWVVGGMPHGGDVLGQGEEGLAGMGCHRCQGGQGYRQLGGRYRVENELGDGRVPPLPTERLAGGPGLVGMAGYTRITGPHAISQVAHASPTRPAAYHPWQQGRPRPDGSPPIFWTEGPVIIEPLLMAANRLPGDEGRACRLAPSVAGGAGHARADGVGRGGDSSGGTRPAPAGARVSRGEPGRPLQRSNCVQGRHGCRLAAGPDGRDQPLARFGRSSRVGHARGGVDG